MPHDKTIVLANQNIVQLKGIRDIATRNAYGCISYDKEILSSSNLFIVYKYNLVIC